MGSKVIFYTPWIGEANNSNRKKFPLSRNKKQDCWNDVLNPSMFAFIQELAASLFVDLS